MSSNPAINSSEQKPSAGSSSQKKTPITKMLGKYRIEKKIGSGGMGTVFLAEHMELHRVVALKVLPVSKASNPTLVKRFKSEARAAANLKHENIVTVYEAGEAAGRFYIALEYIDGKDVLQILQQKGRISVERSVDIVKQTARALQHAFEQNIVHRDIKPSNLLIDAKGIVKLTDMGLARSVDDTAQTQITRDGTTVGTVDYMSPEQARDSKEADIRSDLYSLGCAWYQMLTLQVPFGSGSMTNKLNAHATQSPPDPRSINSKIPESIVAIIHRTLAKNPDDRYQTPRELINELDSVSLKQRNVSDDVLAGLSGKNNKIKKRRQRQVSSSATTNQGAVSTTSPTALPPKTKKAGASNGAGDSAGFHVAPFKFALMGLLAAMVLIGIYWLTTFFGSLSNSTSTPMQNNHTISQPQESVNTTLPKKNNTKNKTPTSANPPISREEPKIPSTTETDPKKKTDIKPGF